MALPDSVSARVRRDFPEGERGAVEARLATYGEGSSPEGRERVLLDILLLAQGDPSQVEELVRRALQDYRDILLWAEYPSQSRLDTPEKVDEFNRMLGRFGAKWRVPEGEGKP